MSSPTTAGSRRSPRHVKTLRRRSRAIEAVSGHERVDVRSAHGTTVADERGAARAPRVGTGSLLRPTGSRRDRDRVQTSVRRCTTRSSTGPAARSCAALRRCRADAGRTAESLPFDGTVPAIPDAVDAIAVCLLHADLDAHHERAVAEALRAAYRARVVCSHEVSPEFREYERMVTTVVEAFLEPVCAPYLQRVASFAPDALVMTSAGGLVPATDGARPAASLLLSGPAGGVRAAAEIARACGFPGGGELSTWAGRAPTYALCGGGVPEPTPRVD